MNKISELEDIPTAVPTATNYNKQIERTSRQLSCGADLVSINQAWKIQAA